MVWDIAVPAGVDPVSSGDDVIRAMKSDLQNAFRGQDTDGVEAIFPGSDTSLPIYRYRGLKGATGARPTAGQYGLYFDTSRNSLQRDNGSAWEDIATAIPAGTVMVFFQAAAPVGWTKVVTQDDKALRVVSGAGGGSGGTQALSTTLAHSHTVDSHTHSVSFQSGSPSDLVSVQSGVGGACPSVTHTHDVSGTTGATAPGTDAQLGPLAYADVILCSKD